MKDSSKSQAIKTMWDQRKTAEHTRTPAPPFALRHRKLKVFHVYNSSSSKHFHIKTPRQKSHVMNPPIDSSWLSGQLEKLTEHHTINPFINAIIHYLQTIQMHENLAHTFDGWWPQWE